MYIFSFDADSESVTDRSDTKGEASDVGVAVLNLSGLNILKPSNDKTIKTTKTVKMVTPKTIPMAWSREVTGAFNNIGAVFGIKIKSNTINNDIKILSTTCKLCRSS
jgi:hypothetical protein